MKRQKSNGELVVPPQRIQTSKDQKIELLRERTDILQIKDNCHNTLQQAQQRERDWQQKVFNIARELGVDLSRYYFNLDAYDFYLTGTAPAGQQQQLPLQPPSQPPAPGPENGKAE